MRNLRIGFLTVHGDEENHTQMLNGILEAADKYDVSIVRYAVSITLDNYVEENIELLNAFKVIESQNLDGLLFLGWMPGVAGPFFDSFIDRFSNLPLISVGVNYPNIPNTHASSEKPIRNMFKHLIEFHGYKNIVYIPPFFPDVRRDIYIDEMKKHGIFREELLLSYEELSDVPQSERIHRIAEIIYNERHLTVDAFFCAYDTDTQDLYIELPRRGLSIPTDVAVVSNEDSEFARFSLPPVSVVTFPWREVGYLGCEKLVRFLRNEEFTNSSGAAGKIIIRNSCGCRTEREKLSRVSDRIDDLFVPTAGYGRIHDFFSELVSEYPITGLDIELLLNTLVFVFEQRSLDLFVDEFQSELDRTVKKFPEQAVVDRIEDFLYGLRSLVLPQLQGDKDDILLFEDLFLMCIVLLQENRIVVTGYENTVIRKARRDVLHLCQEIGSTLNLEKLVTMLEKGLPKINIPSCYIYLATDESFTDFSLLMAYSNGITLDPDRESVSTTLSLPAITRHHSRLMGQVLQVDGEFIGVILFEPVIIDTRIYNMMSRQVASALKGALLHDDLKFEMELRRYKEQQLLHSAHYDSLTDLYNRRTFERMMEILADGMDNVAPSTPFYLFYIDFDNFKSVNDTYGHDAGDLLIQEVARRFQRVVDPFSLSVSEEITAEDPNATNAAVFRIGGDEFTALVRYLPRPEIKNLLQTLLTKVKAPFRIGNASVRVSLSVGVCAFPYDAKTSAQLIRLADTAMYHAKEKKDMFCFFDEL